MVSIEKIHPTGQAITLLAQKYDLPSEVEKKIQDLVFCNKIPKKIQDKMCWYSKKVYESYNFKNFLNSWNYKYNNMNIYGLEFRTWTVYSHMRHVDSHTHTTIKDLKATLKQLIKYNNLKIPISNLKKNELISLLIHTEF